MGSSLSSAQRTEFLALSTLEQQYTYVAQALMALQSVAKTQPGGTEYIQFVPNLNTARLYVSVRLPLLQTATAQFPTQQVIEIFPSLASPTPTPTPTPAAPSAAGVAYTASQSSNYSGQIGTYTNLSDGNGTTGTITYLQSPSFIVASFPYPVLVAAVTVGGGNLANIGAVADTLNGSKVQYSLDNANWTDVWTVAGVMDGGANQFVTYQLPTPITAQYWRLQGGYNMGTSEFRFT